MKKVAFYTLGCKLNYAETSSISRLFTAKGFEKVEFGHPTDVYVINTCSVTEHADKKARKVVKEALKISPDAYVVVVGCYAQLKPKEISEIPGVDAVLGAAEKFRIFDFLTDFQKKGNGQVFASDIETANTFVEGYSIADRTRTFLKVQDGCDYSCTFCTIPLSRGASRSPFVADIIRQAEEIAAQGVKEIVLTGVNIGDFGLHHGKREERFFDLVQALDKVEGIDRFRISSIEPNLLGNDIISFVAQSKKFVPHFHIPLQSGNNKVLAGMRRRYKRELYAERVETIKQLMPHCCIGVDVITGFPGETEADFLDTYNFINDLDISYLHVFTYSERPNTKAIEMADPVPVAERQRRTRMLQILSEKKRRHFYESQLGTEQEVLFEAAEEAGKMHGFTRNYVKTSTKFDPLRVNEVLRVRLTGFDDAGLMTVEEVEIEQFAH
jgi:threonylcarbamoyladenosine tRNA methylthiotransferase MtaB